MLAKRASNQNNIRSYNFVNRVHYCRNRACRKHMKQCSWWRGLSPRWTLAFSVKCEPICSLLLPVRIITILSFSSDQNRKNDVDNESCETNNELNDIGGCAEDLKVRWTIWRSNVISPHWWAKLSAKRLKILWHRSLCMSLCWRCSDQEPLEGREWRTSTLISGRMLSRSEILSIHKMNMRYFLRKLTEINYKPYSKKTEYSGKNSELRSRLWPGHVLRFCPIQSLWRSRKAREAENDPKKLGRGVFVGSLSVPRAFHKGHAG